MTDGRFGDMTEARAGDARALCWPAVAMRERAGEARAGEAHRVGEATLAMRTRAGDARGDDEGEGEGEARARARIGDW